MLNISKECGIILMAFQIHKIKIKEEGISINENIVKILTAPTFVSTIFSTISIILVGYFIRKKNIVDANSGKFYLTFYFQLRFLR